VRTPSSNRRTPQRRPVGLPVLIVLIVVVAAGAGTWWFYTSRAAVFPAGLPMEISVAEAAARRTAGAFILDVRQPEEWVEAHIPESTLIPLGELARRISEVPRGGEIVVVCRSGNRSRTGRDILRSAGLRRATSMAGGLRQWAAAGHPTVSGP
jgi:rhodanese-related sulfurtransferase